MRELRPEDWRSVGDVVSAHDNHPDKPDVVFDAFMAAAFRGEIPWEKDAEGRPTTYGRVARLRSGNVSRLLRAMAEEVKTPSDLRGLFIAMDCAAANNMRGATGSAGDVLLNRASGEHGAKPLPVGWKQVAEAETVRAGARSGGFWAQHMLQAAGRRGHGEESPGREIA